MINLLDKENSLISVPFAREGRQPSSRFFSIERGKEDEIQKIKNKSPMPYT